MTIRTTHSDTRPNDVALPSAALSKARTDFVDEMVAHGVVMDDGWLDAFRHVPRDAFVPFFFRPLDGEHRWQLVERPSREWLVGAFSMKPLVTQLDGDDAALAIGREKSVVTGYTPTSSSTRPSAVAFMLNALDVDDGQRVLEIGTGTGWLTGLLCHRLGSDFVTSIDVDPSVLSRARQSLNALGHRPYLKAGDGRRGCRARAPFDLLVATVAVRQIPRPWVVQSRTGGRMLVPIDLGAAGGLVARLTVHNTNASGPFLADRRGFMPVRSDNQPGPIHLPPVDAAQARPTALPVTAVTSAAGAFFCALLVGNYECQTLVAPSDSGREQTLITDLSGAWVRHTANDDGTHLIHQGGPRLLWNELESAHHVWDQLGQPEHDRFGLTATYGKKHSVWLDDPRGPHQWPLA